jgi:hypothetical protein
MKTNWIIVAALTLFAFGNMKAQDSLRMEQPNAQTVNAIVVDGTGDVHVKQGTQFFVKFDKSKLVPSYQIDSNTLTISGNDSYSVTLPELNDLKVTCTGDVISMGQMNGKNLSIEVTGTGNVNMEVYYDTISLLLEGTGDVTLRGKCLVMYADLSGTGDVYVQGLDCSESHVVATGLGKVKTKGSHPGTAYSYYRERRQSEKKSLLFDASWNGFEAGLNMLINTSVDAANVNNGVQGMDLRPLRSWYFGFNIADVGIAFNRRHTAGAFTGIGLGWNNFSWDNDVQIGYDSENMVYTLIPIEEEKAVKNSKYGALFLQVPMMVEIRPIRRMYVDVGFTGGLRIAQWNRVKFDDGSQHKHYYNANMNLFKMDASLRVGGYDMGFFFNYSLLPLFVMTDVKVHPVNFGFSINF